MSFLKLIIFILILYLFFRIFVLYIGPFLLRLFMKRMQKRFFRDNPHINPENSKQGKVTIHRMKDTKNNDIPSELGDYIDYEEVKNNQNPTNE